MEEASGHDPTLEVEVIRQIREVDLRGATTTRVVRVPCRARNDRIPHEVEATHLIPKPLRLVLDLLRGLTRPGVGRIHRTPDLVRILLEVDRTLLEVDRTILDPTTPVGAVPTLTIEAQVTTVTTAKINTVNLLLWWKTMHLLLC